MRCSAQVPRRSDSLSFVAASRGVRGAVCPICQLATNPARPSYCFRSGPNPTQPPPAPPSPNSPPQRPSPDTPDKIPPQSPGAGRGLDRAPWGLTVVGRLARPGRAWQGRGQAWQGLGGAWMRWGWGATQLNATCVVWRCRPCGRGHAPILFAPISHGSTVRPVVA